MSNMNWQGDVGTNWVGTNLGKRIDLTYPLAEQIDIMDIAAGLGNQCRFTGQIRHHYSVAEHCIHVAALVPDKYKLAALLHDAQEAYISDLSTPMKREVGRGYSDVEKRIVRALDDAFGMDGMLIELPDCIKDADRIMLLTERDHLVEKRIWWGEAFESTVRHPSFTPKHLDNPAGARAAYLAEFDRLNALRREVA